MNADLSLVVKIAAQFNIPPSILDALVTQAGGNLATSASMLSAFGVSASDVQDNPELQLSMLASQAAQLQQQYGSWEAAVSTLVSGSPTTYQQPGSDVGGQVYSVLGKAASNPTLGMDSGFAPKDAMRFTPAAHALTQTLTDMSKEGGVVDPSKVDQFSKAAAQIAAPFDPKYDASISQGFGPTGDSMEPSGGGYAHFHTGVDYEVPDRSPLAAMKTGTIHVNRSWGSGPSGAGWNVTLKADDGWTYLYGHVSGFAVQDGQHVDA